ncbi:transglycosylase family protein [Arthrobacter sp. H35-D1]|uniref:transglycosylase family protein n=1 Tax=Arthrobacter sp. H35-D1 TaxID=3046202 RepID=UPI0024B931BC|nr:transglycosylase family protein [Arthrobacter sp. H35-D1]MDJ0312848.1 transglycosylase family protein [Arthrobacter sp. H35-D1]
MVRNFGRVLAVGALVGGGLAVAGTGANAASGGTWDALAQCESGGDWGISTGNGFSGGLQFTPSTWAAFGGAGAPQNASRAEQIAVAERVQAGQGWGAWPSCSAQLGLSGGGGQAYSPAAVPAPAPVVAQSSQVVPVQQAPVQQAPVQQAPVQQAPVQQAPVQQAPVQQAPVQQAPATVALSGETYTIQSGDTLSTIADKLGIQGGWQALYQANADTVIHADLIFTGAVLQLPA